MIKTFKGFKKDMTCRGFQLGQTYITNKSHGKFVRVVE